MGTIMTKISNFKKGIINVNTNKKRQYNLDLLKEWNKQIQYWARLNYEINKIRQKGIYSLMNVGRLSNDHLPPRILLL